MSIYSRPRIHDKQFVMQASQGWKDELGEAAYQTRLSRAEFVRLAVQEKIKNLKTEGEIK